MVVGIIDHATGTRDIRRLAWLGRAQQAAADHRRRRDGEHGGAAAVPRFRRQGGRLRNRAAQPDHWARAAPYRARRHRARLGVHHHLQPAVPVGRVRPQGPAEPSTRVAEMHARVSTFLSPPAHPGRGGPAVRAVAVAAGQRRSTPTPTRCPADGDYDLALWHGLGLPLLLSALVLGVGTAAFFGRSPAAPRRRCDLPLGNADRIYDAASAGVDVLSVRLTAVTQRGSIPATQSAILATLVLVPVVGAGPGRPRSTGLRAVGLAAPGGGRAARCWRPRSARP